MVKTSKIEGKAKIEASRICLGRRRHVELERSGRKAPVGEERGADVDVVIVGVPIRDVGEVAALQLWRSESDARGPGAASVERQELRGEDLDEAEEREATFVVGDAGTAGVDAGTAGVERTKFATWPKNRSYCGHWMSASK